MSPPTHDELTAALAVISAEGQGILTLELHDATILPDLLAREATQPTKAGGRLLGAFGRLGDAILDATADSPRLCLTCHTPFGADAFPVAVALLKPAVADPAMALIHGLCAGCVDASSDRAGLVRAVTEALAVYAGWDLRPLDRWHAAGHA